MALPGPRGYIVNFFGPNDEAYELHEWTAPPACLMVSQESRRQALRWLTKIPLFHDENLQRSDSENDDDDDSTFDHDKKRRDKKRRTNEKKDDEKSSIRGKYLGRDIPEWKRSVYINFAVDWVYIMRKTEYYLSVRPYAIWEWSERVQNLAVDWRVWKASKLPLDDLVNSFPTINNFLIVGESTAKPFPLIAEALPWATLKIGTAWMVGGEFVKNRLAVEKGRSDLDMDVTVVGMTEVYNNGEEKRALQIKFE